LTQISGYEIGDDSKHFIANLSVICHFKADYIKIEVAKPQRDVLAIQREREQGLKTVSK
jgi:hypothetical protein